MTSHANSVDERALGDVDRLGGLALTRWMVYPALIFSLLFFVTPFLVMARRQSSGSAFAGAWKRRGHWPTTKSSSRATISSTP